MRVTTPVKNFSGTVVGVQFNDGVGDTNDPIAIAYFARHGYNLAGEEHEPDNGDVDTPETPTSEASGDEKHTEDPEEDTPAVKPAGNASKQAWYEYALASGFDADELDGLDRNELRDLVAD